jgi:DNA-binding protein Fis
MFTPYEIQHQQEIPIRRCQLFRCKVKTPHSKKVLNYTKGNKAETARLLEIALQHL